MTTSSSSNPRSTSRVDRTRSHAESTSRRSSPRSPWRWSSSLNAAHCPPRSRTSCSRGARGALPCAPPMGWQAVDRRQNAPNGLTTLTAPHAVAQAMRALAGVLAWHRLRSRSPLSRPACDELGPVNACGRAQSMGWPARRDALTGPWHPHALARYVDRPLSSKHGVELSVGKFSCSVLEVAERAL